MTDELAKALAEKTEKLEEEKRAVAAKREAEMAEAAKTTELRLKDYVEKSQAINYDISVLLGTVPPALKFLDESVKAKVSKKPGNFYTRVPNSILTDCLNLNTSLEGFVVNESTRPMRNEEQAKYYHERLAAFAHKYQSKIADLVATIREHGCGDLLPKDVARSVGKQYKDTQKTLFASLRTIHTLAVSLSHPHRVF